MDFVTNSSSTSFCVYGCELFDEQRHDIAERCYEIGLEFIEPDDDYVGYLIGLHPDEMTDDETLGDFKKRVQEKIREIGLEPNEISFHSGTMYN